LEVAPRKANNHAGSPRKKGAKCRRRVKNKGYAVSLELRKLYVALPDAQAAKHRQLRVIDESGEDYLYPQELFVALELPQALRRRVLQAA
jgi:hypothetical protein